MLFARQNSPVRTHAYEIALPPRLNGRLERQKPFDFKKQAIQSQTPIQLSDRQVLWVSIREVVADLEVS